MNDRIKSGDARNLLDRDDRLIARIAARATTDTNFGGCRALVLAERLERMGCKVDVVDVVSHVYSASTGHALPEYRVCVCPECGQTVLGEDAAVRCCSDLYEPEREFVDEDETDDEDPDDLYSRLVDR